MKVTFNTYPTAFDCPGGGEIQLLKTKEALVEAGVEIKLFNQWQPQLDWPRVVHHFSVYGGSSVFCNYVKQHKKIPLAISPILWLSHDTSSYPMLEISHLFRIADILFPNSALEADLLSESFGIERAKFHVTYNGVDPLFTLDSQPSPDVFRTKYDVQGEFFLNVANIETRKNQILLAEAAAGLRIPVYNFGNIRDLAYYQQVVRAGRGFFKHLGYIGHDDLLLRSAYKACAGFILPSLLETPGLAALEAASLGAKLGITQVGSAREYFGKHALYVDPQSVNSVKAVMEELRNYSVKSQELRAHIIQNFTWKNTASQCLAGYQKIIF